MIDRKPTPDAETKWRQYALRLPLVVVLLGGLSGPLVAAGQSEEAVATVSGQVLGEDSSAEQKLEATPLAVTPLAAAQVYAYELASLKLAEVLSDKEGRFTFSRLPAGLYKIVAYKAGFAPSVELLLRRTKDVRQFVELRLREETPLSVSNSEAREAESYWDARARIPADVLRHLDREKLLQQTADAGLMLAEGALFSAAMVAESGVRDLGQGEALLTEAAFELRGVLGSMALSFDGRYEQMMPSGESSSGLPGGEARSLAFNLSSARDDQLSLLSSAGEMANLQDGHFIPVDISHHQLRWSGPTGAGSSSVLAQLITESNYYRGLGMQSSSIPEMSSTWAIEGAYHREVGDATSVRTGVGYRSREVRDPTAMAFGGEGEVSAYGLAGSQVQSRVLVEYGLYSSLRGENLSLTPHGGVVVKLGKSWQASTSFSQRVEQTSAQEELYPDFNTAFYGDGTTCQRVGESCYEVSFAHGREDEDGFRVGAIHREYAETLRLYFSDDFFDRLESLVVVPGDEIPEVKLRMVRHLSPRVLAKLESNYAVGGGGIFYATDKTTYENEVRYLVTSLDTRFQQTATGIFIAFHHLEQALKPTGDNDDASSSEHEMQRLQLMLTQDLSALANLTSNWALRLNMELTRGSDPYGLTTNDELHKKLTGGVTVSF
jgi:hypothetical protein